MEHLNLSKLKVASESRMYMASLIIGAEIVGVSSVSVILIVISSEVLDIPASILVTMTKLKVNSRVLDVSMSAMVQGSVMQDAEGYLSPSAVI